MLINRIEDAEAKGDCESGTNNVTNYAQEYQTANELFDLMTKEHSFDDTGDDLLTTRDLVILYENIEMGTKLTSDAKQVKRSNQLVETIIYNDESESEISDNYSSADLINLCRANEETMNLLQSNSSYENTLCRKISRMEIQTSIHSYGHEKFFLFKDPLIKGHLKSLRSSCMDFESQLLPSTLLDYLCCQRLEENYTFNMDNIIRHVTHTIEQLKRISNGDYLTEKAKEMWKEVHDENIHTSKIKSKSTKMIATRTRFPLHIERKITGTPSCWDIVHSEIDLRSLSKLLEKKKFLEIPKLICGSFKLFSKQCAENLIIRCKQSCSEESVTKDIKESHVDVVLQLERSETGQVMSTVNSIMILDGIPKVHQEETAVMLALPYGSVDEPRDNPEVSHKEDEFEKLAIEEENKSDSIIDGDKINLTYTSAYLPGSQEITDISEVTYNKTFNNDDEDTDNKSNCSNYSEYAQEDCNDACSEDKYGMVEELKSTLKEVIQSQSTSHDLPYRGLVCDELHLTMRSLVMPDTLPEENEESSTIPPKNISPTRVRVKSPYENKSRLIEEKKRKKLLEIKERRERKRNALNENNKVTKHKFNNRSSVMPQASGSVTKLSISNKSFYNSIYGKNLELENNINNMRYRKREPISDVSLNDFDNNDFIKDIIQLPNKNNMMVNNYLYLDDSAAKMEMAGSVLESTLAEPNVCDTSLNVLHQFDRPSLNEIKEIHTIELQEKLDELELVDSEPYSDVLLPHVNITYNNKEKVKESPSTITTTDDCRESIDKLYDLMNKLENPITSTNDYCPIDLKTKNTVDIDIADIHPANLTIHDCESGSLMQQSISSNASNMSLAKHVSRSTKTRNIEPKVIISSKNQKNTNENNKKNRKIYHTSHGSNVKPVVENPLKAISQLLHNIENVQKIRKKTTFDTKAIKKSEEPQKENKYRLRFNIDNKRQSEDLNRTTTDKYLHFNSNIPRALPRTNLTIQSPRQILKSASEDRHSNFTKKKMSDILDEVKEARGEAVRGPAKFNSRLNTLAQPKKSYVQAHNQEYQSKYGRSVAADRLQRLAVAERSSNMRNKQKRGGHESSSVKPPSASSVPPIETSRRRRSRSSSPNERAYVGAKSTQKRNNGSASLVPKPTAVLESCIMSHYVHENSTKILLQQPLPQGHTKLRDFNTSSRLQPPTRSLEYLEVKSNLNDSINTMISTIPLDYKKSDPDMKNNNYPLLTKFAKMDSLIAEDGSFDEEEELCYEQSTIKSTISKDSELTRLESALNFQNSSDVLQKRLRIKNLTLTPKPSSKHVLIVHSGDGSSVVLKSKISQKFKVNTSKSEINYSLQSLSKYITNIPLQMFTVGYTFQQYQSLNAKSKCEHFLRPKGSIVSFTQNFIPNPMQKKISDVNVHIKPYKVTEIDHNFKSKKQKDGKLKYSTSAYEVVSKVGSTKHNSCNEFICITEANGAITSPTIDENVKLSTSLDILVQLLDEIKNITTCQSQISPPVYDSKEVKDIFNNIAFQKKVDATKVIDVSTSIHNDLNTFSQLNNDRQELYQRNILRPKSFSTVSCFKTPTVFDKEIDVKLNEKEYENKVTEIPFQDLMLNISQSTSVTNSLLGLYCKPSTQTMYSVSEHRSICSTTSIDSKRKSIRFPIQNCDDQAKLLVKLADNKQIVSKPIVICKKNDCTLLKNKSIVNHNVKRYKVQQHLNTNSLGFDHTMKLKRDILVTVYSILVVTIFAALSLPQVV